MSLSDCINLYSLYSVLQVFYDDITVLRSHYAWKYGAHRVITGTSLLIINRVHYHDASDFTNDEWSKCIDYLIQNPWMWNITCYSAYY